MALAELTGNAFFDCNLLLLAIGGGGGPVVTTTGSPAAGNLSKFSAAMTITNGDLSGDVTTAGALVTTIGANKVTYAKIQAISANSKLLGSSATGGGASPVEITLGSGLTMIGSTLSATGSGGTVTTTGSPASGNLSAFSGVSSITNTDLTGDVTTSGTVATTIAAGAVTYAKMQNVSASSKLLGSGGSGGGAPPVEITIGSGLMISGTTLSATGSGGTVTTTGSPATGNLSKFSGATSITNGDLTGDVTTSGALATTIASSAVTTAKIAASAVTYAKIQNVAANSVLLGAGASGGGSAPVEIALGSGLTMTGTTLSATGGSGTVTHTGGALTAGALVFGNAGADIIVGTIGPGVDIQSNKLIGLLGSNAYAPASNTFYSTTSTTYADLDATNMAVTFTAPASGRVLIRLTAYADMSLNTSLGGWGLREGSTNLTCGGTSIRDTNGDVFCMSFFLSGISAGSHTYKWSSAVGGGLTLRTGAGPGNTSGTLSTSAGILPALMEVWAA